MYYPIFIPLNGDAPEVFVPEFVANCVKGAVIIAVIGALLLIIEMINEFCLDRESKKLFRVAMFVLSVGFGLSIIMLVIALVVGEEAA